MGAVPQPFGSIPTQALANFNFNEFATGEGIVSFYGYTSYESNSSSGALTSNASAYSNDLYTQAPQAMNFDTSAFNSPVLLKGTATYYLPTSITTAQTGSYSINLIRANSDGTLTTITTSSGGQLVSAGQAYKVVVMRAFPPETKINVGDKIRVQITTIGASDMYLGHDPADRDTGAAGATPFGDDAIASINGRTGTKMIIQLPFKVDLS